MQTRSRLVSLVVASAIVVASLGAACGPPTRPRQATEADLRNVAEGRAIELIGEIAAEDGLVLAADWPIDLGQTDPFEVDVRLGDSRYGIEWVSPQDRNDWDELLPAPDPNGQLRILPGVGDDADAQVFLLEFTSYRYDPDLERVQRGSPGAREAEGRLRRDVRDILEYVRGQGAI